MLSPRGYEDSHVVSPSAESDDMLGLPADKVRVLKKTLYFYSRYFTDDRENEVYCVSWNVADIHQPPDNLGPVLPPSSWQVPCLLIFGLQGVREGCELDWTNVFAESIEEVFVAGEYVNLFAQGYTYSEGCLTLIFVKKYATKFIHGVSVQKLVGAGCPALGVRFGLHQAAVAVLNIALPHVPVQRNDEAKQNGTEQEAVPDEDTSASGVSALAHQIFKSVVQKFRFDLGTNTVFVSDCPVSLFLGCKDLESQALAELDLEDSDKFFSLSEDYYVMNRLSFTDLRISPKATGSGIVKLYDGAVGVLKAGVMRLMIQVTDGDGIIGRPEVTLFRFVSPTVDLERLPAVYRNVWRLLVDSSDLRSSIKLQPSMMEITELRPFQPTKFKIRLRNSSRLPAVFSVLCLSDSGRNFVPIARHSLLYKGNEVVQSTSTAAYLGTTPAAVSSSSADVVVRSRHSDSATSTGRATSPRASTASKPGDFSKMITKWKKQVGKVTGTGLMPPKATTGPKLTIRESEDQSSGKRVGFADRRRWAGANFQQASESGYDVCDEEALEENSSSFDTSAEPTTILRPQVSWSTSKTLEMRSDAVKEEVDLTRWVHVSPSEGVVLPGKEVSVSIRVECREAVTLPQKVPGMLLAVRLDDCDCDGFFCLSTTIVPTFYGQSLRNLHTLRYKPLTPNRGRKTGVLEGEENLVPDDAEAATFVMGQNEADDSMELPLPKEVWWLLSYIYSNAPKQMMTSIRDTVLGGGDSAAPFDGIEATQAAINTTTKISKLLSSGGGGVDMFEDSPSFSLLALMRDIVVFDCLPNDEQRSMRLVRQCLEVGATIPTTTPIAAALRVLEKWGHSLPVPLVPNEFLSGLTDESDDNNHLMCRAAALALPIISRNCFVCIVSLMRYIISVSVHIENPTKIPALEKAVAVWLSHFLLRDSDVGEAAKFVGHFLTTSDWSIDSLLP
eukprot:Lankesteria_metandrocarpae@DN2124_c0_g1_i1.p1